MTTCDYCGTQIPHGEVETVYEGNRKEVKSFEDKWSPSRGHYTENKDKTVVEKIPHPWCGDCER